MQPITLEYTADILTGIAVTAMPSLFAQGDKLAAQLGLDAQAYDKQFYGPAFQLLDDPGACDRIGPTAQPLIARLKAMGGGTTPLSRSQ